jgi:hypothetical protein
MHSDSHRLSLIGGQLFEIKTMLQQHFISWSFVYVPRSCNKVAHALAAVGCNCSPNSTLQWDGTPHGVEDLVTSDIAESVS